MNESLDVLGVVSEHIGEGKSVAVGLGNGKVGVVGLGTNKAVAEVSHDEVEGVPGLGFEIGRRMISEGCQVMKVWHEV